MSEAKMHTTPPVLGKMMESPVPLDGDKELYKQFLDQLTAELQPRGTIDWTRVIRLAQWEWNSALLKKYRRLLIERQRGQLMEKKVIEANVPPGRKPNREELKAARTVAAQRMDELCGVRLDIHSARAVCEAADDLGKMDALIEKSEHWCALMRAECEPLAVRARAEAQLRSAHLEQALEKPDTAPMLTHTKTPIEEGAKQVNQANIHQEVAPAFGPEAASLSIGAGNSPLPSDYLQRKDDAVPQLKYKPDEIGTCAETETSAAT
jgi:hypothetical protein